MKVHLECIPCLLRQALEATKLSSTYLATQERALREVMDYLSNVQWDNATPELATCMHRLIKRVTGNADPYNLLKEKYNCTALGLYPKLAAFVEASEDPLLTAAKLAIAGNIIDFGPKMEINLEKGIAEVLRSDLAINDVDKLKESLLGSKVVLYLADNAGESVFDTTGIAVQDAVTAKLVYTKALQKKRGSFIKM